MFVPRQVKRQASATKAKKCRPVGAVAPPGEIPHQAKRQRLDSVSTLSTTTGTTLITIAAGHESKIYYEEIRCGLELLLSDYAYAGPESRKWLLERERRVDGEQGYIHLSAFLDSAVFARSKPPVTQLALQKALELCGSEFLELSPDRYHIRRVGTTRPTEDSVDWDAQTIYVEPHLASLALSPPKLVYHLLSHHHAPSSIIPVQHVHIGKRPSYAFVVLSSPVHGIGAQCWPIDWVVLTKYAPTFRYQTHIDDKHRAEWKRRDSEYQALRIAESRPSYYSTDDSNVRRQRPTVPVVPSRTETQCVSTKRCHPTGLLVYLTNLHPSATKSSIAALISHHVDKHFRKLHPNQEGTVSGDQLVRSPSISTPDTTSLGIMYTDYIPGTTTATIRLASATDANNVITTLAADRVLHSTKNGRRSRADGKDAGGEQGNAIKAELVTGERERIYWEECVWKGKRGKRAKKRVNQDISQEGLVYDDPGADIHEGNLQGEAESAFEKDPENLNSRANSTRKHIRFED
ncbi:MAG: hypothetical protein M1839_006895 [Geoglossum umbratile]|nr:MAG: hypothetical protein M1839_006895 [Geoglossum umbratile]